MFTNTIHIRGHSYMLICQINGTVFFSIEILVVFSKE